MSGVYCASHGSTRSLCQGHTAQVIVALGHCVRSYTAQVIVALCHFVRVYCASRGSTR